MYTSELKVYTKKIQKEFLRSKESFGNKNPKSFLKNLDKNLDEIVLALLYDSNAKTISSKFVSKFFYNFLDSCCQMTWTKTWMKSFWHCFTTNFKFGNGLLPKVPQISNHFFSNFG